jgi:dihydroorotate dehydrogenase electron transfer subunit
MLLTKQHPKLNIDLIIGAANANTLVFNTDYAKLLPQAGIHICTDDGSAGLKGYTTTAATDLLAKNHYDYIASCGPEPMQAKIAQIAAQFNVPCEVSLERRMACGLGACLSCIVQTTSGQKRACVDGPVFDARQVIL